MTTPVTSVRSYFDTTVLLRSFKATEGIPKGLSSIGWPSETRRSSTSVYIPEQGDLKVKESNPYNISPGETAYFGRKSSDWSVLNSTEIDVVPQQWRAFYSTPPTSTSLLVQNEDDLREAIQELDETKEEALECDISLPPPEVYNTVERLIRSLYSVLPIRPLVELLSDSSIAIRMIGPKGYSVTTIIEASGESLVIVRLKGKTHRRAWYLDANSLIDGFTEEALLSLRKALISAAK